MTGLQNATLMRNKRELMLPPEQRTRPQALKWISPLKWCLLFNTEGSNKIQPLCFILLLLCLFPVNEISACLKEFGRTCLYKEILRECEGSLRGERSMPKLHCCNVSHGRESEESHRCLVEMSGTCWKHSHHTQRVLPSGPRGEMP